MQKLAPDFRKVLDVAFDRAISHLEHLDELSVAATADAAALRAHIDKPLAQEGVPPQQVIEELVRDVEGGLLGSAGGRFFGWVIGGATRRSRGLGLHLPGNRMPRFTPARPPPL